MTVNDEKKHQEFLNAYDSFADAIFRHCFFRISNAARAQEITQDAFMRAWDSIAHGKVVENMRAFLYRIANNLIIDEYKKKKATSLDELVEDGFQPESKDQNWNDVIDAKQLVQCLDKVEEPYRSAVIMRYLDGFSPKEIAETTKVSPNVISVRITRGLDKLRQLFPSL